MTLTTSLLLLCIFATALSARVTCACSDGNCQLLDPCSSNTDCEAGLYCSACLVKSPNSRCIRKETTNPFKIVNNLLPFNKYAFLTTHNSYAITGEPSHTGVPRITFTNQEDNVTEQLNNGVRSLMLDTYDFKGDVWLCHSPGGNCNDFTAFGPAIDTLKQIEAFLSANPSEIITIILEDYVHAPHGLTKLYVADGNGGMKSGSCPNRSESSPLDDLKKSLVLMNFFPSDPDEFGACQDNSDMLSQMLRTCYTAAGNRWANFLAVDYYKRSEGGGAFQAVDTLNGKLICGCDDIHACEPGATSKVCTQ